MKDGKVVKNKTTHHNRLRKSAGSYCFSYNGRDNNNIREK